LQEDEDKGGEGKWETGCDMLRKLLEEVNIFISENPGGCIALSRVLMGDLG